jgi:hypothetical protein
VVGHVTLRLERVSENPAPGRGLRPHRPQRRIMRVPRLCRLSNHPPTAGRRMA